MAVSKIQRSSLLSQINKRVKNPELVKKFEEILADDIAAEELNSMFLSRSEATKLVQDIKRQESELAAQQQKLATDYANLQAWEVRAKQEEITARQQAIEVAKEAHGLVGRLREKALADTLTVADLEDAYKNPKIASLATSPTPTPTPAPTPAAKKESPTPKEPPMSNPSTTPNTNPDDAGRAFIQGIGKLFKLQNDHRNLFKEELDVDALLNTALQEGRPIEDVYNDSFDVAAKQKELEQSRFEAAVNAKVDELVTAKLSTMIDPSGKSAHIGDFASLMKKETSPVWSGLGMTAKELNPDFRAMTMTQEEADAERAKFQTSVSPVPNQRQEEMEIAAEFANNLAKRG